MPEIPKPPRREMLRMELDPSPDHMLEQLLESAKRIELGMDATYAAVVGLDDMARVKMTAAVDPVNLQVIREVRERYAYACNAQMPVITMPRELLLGILLMIDPSAVKSK